MNQLSAEVVTGQLLAVLREAFEGAGEWSYFNDDGPEASLLGAGAKLGAAEASRPCGGSSVAAHVHHITFGLCASTARIGGDRTPRNWDESWRVSSVDATAWAGLQAELHAAYEDFRDAIQAHAATSAETLGLAVGTIAHAAYHLGAIKQKAAALAGR